LRTCSFAAADHLAANHDGRRRANGSQSQPEIGIAGNSHMLMMDKNNAVTADLIQTWLAAKGLVD
jgi:hypothetical protein